MMEPGYLYIFAVFYWGAAFGFGGMILSLWNYLEDFFSAPKQVELKSDIKLSFVAG